MVYTKRKRGGFDLLFAKKTKFHYEIGLNKIRRGGLESGLDGPFGEGRNNMVFLIKKNNSRGEIL